MAGAARIPLVSFHLLTCVPAPANRRAVSRGPEGQGTLDSTVCRIEVTSMLTRDSVEDNNGLALEAGVIWEVELDVNLLE